MNFIHKMDQWIEKFCIFFLVIAMLLVLSLSLLNMALRWFAISLLWIDPMVRYLVFACGFLGGTVATGMQKHIRIDAFPRFLEAMHYHKALLYISRLTSLFVICTLSWLIYASWQFYRLELEFGKEEFLGIHSATMGAIVPLGLTLIALRFFARLVESFRKP